jgi:peptidyl-prolyl cis-trans isomerase D
MIKKLSVAAAALTVALTACDSLEDAMSAHTDVAAKAAGQELTITQLSGLMGNSQAPMNKDLINAIVDVWVDYHLAAQAAVENDSLKDPKMIDKAMWAVIDNVKARKWYEQVSKNWHAPDSTAAEGIYNNGQILAASHILLLTKGMDESAKAAVKKKADALRAKVTTANFSEMAKKNSQDPGSKIKGGSLGSFPHGAMVPQFEQALLALKPGEISPVIETPFGYHIIRRPLFPEVKQDIIRASQAVGMQAAESTYLADLDRSSKLVIKPGLAPAVRAVVDNPAGHKSDKTVLATTTLGDFTAADLARWMTTIPPQAGLKERIKSAPDSLMPIFVKNFIRNELVVHLADSAKMGPSSAQLAQIRALFTNSLITAWTALQVDPQTLATAAKSKSDRKKLAHHKVEDYVKNLLAQKAQYVDITQPVEYALREKYDYGIKADGVSRALLQAATVRLHADSAKAAGQPPTVVPVPKKDTVKR